MKIDGGGFGFKTPGEVAGPNPPAQAFVTQGVPELGAQGLKIAGELAQSEQQDAQIQYSETHRQRVEAEAEAKLVAKEAKRAEAMTIHAKAQNALADAHDQLANGVRDGTVGVDAAPKLWQEISTKIVDDHLKAVDKSNVELVRAGLAGNVGAFGRSINEGIVVKNRHEIGAKLNDYLEEMQRLAITDLGTAKAQGVTAIASQAPLAGYNAEQVSKMRHAFIENATFNVVNDQLIKAKNDRGALDQFVKRLPEMQDLDSGKRNVLLNQAQSQLMHLDNKAAAAESRRLNTLARVGNQLEQRIAMGVPMNPKDLDAYQTAAKGTPFEEVASGLVDEQRQVTELLKKTPAEQAAYVSVLEQKLVTTGEGNPRIVKRLQQTVGNTIKMLDQNPLQYAMDRGGAQIEPLDPAKPDSWQENLQHRAAVLDSQARSVGGSRGALFPQEAAQLAHVMATGTPEQKKAYLEPLRRGLGNDQVFRATVQQFAKDSPVTALAASISAKEQPLTVGTVFKESYQPGDTSALMLRGEHLLNPPKSTKQQDGKSKGFPMPQGDGDKAMRMRFADTVGEVFADNEPAYDAQLQGARAVYAALGEQKGDFSGEFDSRRWAESINRSMPVGKFNGRSVMMPWGMAEDRFKDQVRAELPAALKAAGLPVEMANATGRYTLQNETGATYFVRQGTEYLTGPRGRVIVRVPEQPSTWKSPAERAALKVPN